MGARLAHRAQGGKFVMRTVSAFSILAAAVIGSQPAMAAQDPGLLLPGALRHVQRIGAGVQARITVPLGGSRSNAEARRPELSLSAGPSVTRAGSARTVHTRTSIAPMARLAIGPGEPVTLSLAGQPVSGMPQGDRRNVSTLGWVGIGVGAGVIVGGLLLLDALRDASD
jgi:hypothetical protein